MIRAGCCWEAPLSLLRLAVPLANHNTKQPLDKNPSVLITFMCCRTELPIIIIRLLTWDNYHTEDTRVVEGGNVKALSLLRNQLDVYTPSTANYFLGNDVKKWNVDLDDLAHFGTLESSKNVCCHVKRESTFAYTWQHTYPQAQHYVCFPSDVCMFQLTTCWVVQIQKVETKEQCIFQASATVDDVLASVKSPLCGWTTNQPL